MRVSIGVTRKEKFSLEKLELSLQMRSKRYVVNTFASSFGITLQKLRQNYVRKFFFSRIHISQTQNSSIIVDLFLKQKPATV